MKRESEDNGDGIGKSLMAVFRNLRGLTLSLYRFFPAAAISLVLLIVLFGFLITKSEIAAQGAVLALVLIASGAIFVRTRSYTEAFLTLIVGLLPALSMTWSPARFWVFVGGYGLLTGFCLVAASIRIEKDAQYIYIQAANFATREDPAISEMKLKSLAKKARTQSLGPIERADCVRQLMFRNFPIKDLPEALESIEKMSVITGLPSGEIASYMVILYPLVDVANLSFSRLDDRFYLTLRDSAATPEEFFEAFRLTRSLVLEGTMHLDAYLAELSGLLGFGLPPEDIRRRMEAIHDD